MFISNTGRNTRTFVKRKQFVKTANAFCVLVFIFDTLCYNWILVGILDGTLFSIVYLKNN